MRTMTSADKRKTRTKNTNKRTFKSLKRLIRNSTIQNLVLSRINMSDNRQQVVRMWARGVRQVNEKEKRRKEAVEETF